MKIFSYTLFIVCMAAVSLSAQTQVPVKQPEPVSLAKLAREPICREQKISELNEAIKARSTNTDLFVERAICLKLTDNPDFLKDISSVLKLNPILSDDLYANLQSLIFVRTINLRGFEKYERNSNEIIRKNVDYLAAANPDHWFPFAERAELKFSQKDYKGGLEDFIKVIELEPTGARLDNWRVTLALSKLSGDKDVFGFYDLLRNAAQKTHQKLTASLKESSLRSDEYKEIRRGVKAVGSFLQNLCFSLAKLGVKLGNSQIENAALENITRFEPVWRGYLLRSAYYKENKNTRKALADKLDYYLFFIDSKKQELKQAANENERESINGYLGDLYSQLGDLYFQDQQFVKAISSYEKAREFSPSKSSLEGSIKAALLKLNVSAPPP